MIIYPRSHIHDPTSILHLRNDKNIQNVLDGYTLSHSHDGGLHKYHLPNEM